MPPGQVVLHRGRPGLLLKATGLPGYREIETPHAEVHRYAGEAIRAHGAEDIPTMLANLVRMEQASHRVTDGLESMAANGQHQPDVLCTH